MIYRLTDLIRDAFTLTLRDRVKEVDNELATGRAITYRSTRDSSGWDLEAFSRRLEPPALRRILAMRISANSLNVSSSGVD